MADKDIVVIPNHLPHLDFLEEWRNEFSSDNVHLVVVQDSDDQVSIPDGFKGWVYSRADIEQDLGRNAWIIPSRTSACRSYGYYKAWQLARSDVFEGERTPLVYTLDNDCYPDRRQPAFWPDPYWLSGHRAHLGSSRTTRWLPSFRKFAHTRGFPYRIRDASPVVLSHGVWSGVPDLDAATSLQHPNLRFVYEVDTQTIPYGNYFPMCGMNLAWRPELTPAMYFGIFGPDYGFDQYDDIWAGVLVKRVIDHLGFSVVTGAPSVEHRKQSDVFANLRKQAPGLEMNENFWIEVDKVALTATTVVDAYAELITGLPDVIVGEVPGWTKRFKKAALIWADLFR